MNKLLPNDAGLIIESPIDSTELLKLIQKNPAIIVKDFAPSLEEFFSFTEKLNLNFIDYRGGAFHRQEVNKVPTLMTVTGHEKGFPIPLHGELYYQKDQPDFLFFYCVSPALLGGSTTVANAVSFYNSLPQETKQFLQNNSLKYIRKLTVLDWKKVYKTEDKNEVKKICDGLGVQSHFDEQETLITEYISSASYESKDAQTAFLNNILPNYYLQKAGRKEAGIQTADGKELPSTIIASIEKVAKALSVKARLKKGDLLVVNNRAALHGRTAFIGKRQIFLRMGNL